MEINLQEYVNRHAILKFKGGRVISGTIRGSSEAGFTVKLGVLHIPVVPEELLRITLS